MDTYEKKYNEALERAKYVLHTVETAGCAMHKDLLTEIFPELRESEDERVIRTLFFLCKDHDWLNGATKEECLNWLEKQKEPKNTSASTMIPSCWAEEPSLQKEQKPAWSEEDEKMREKLTNLLGSSLVPLTYKEWSDYCFWLKSLRPSWKPTQEQMNELWSAISYIELPGSNYLGVPELLESIYEQLKKL